MTVAVLIGDAMFVAGGFAAAWIFKDSIKAFIAKVKAKI